MGPFSKCLYSPKRITPHVNRQKSSHKTTNIRNTIILNKYKGRETKFSRNHQKQIQKPLLQLVSISLICYIISKVSDSSLANQLAIIVDVQFGLLTSNLNGFIAFAVIFYLICHICFIKLHIVVTNVIYVFLTLVIYLFNYSYLFLGYRIIEETTIYV